MSASINFSFQRFITLYQWYDAYPECKHGWFSVISTSENEFAWKSANKIWLFLSKIPINHSQSLATYLELDTVTWKQNTNPMSGNTNACFYWRSFIWWPFLEKWCLRFDSKCIILQHWVSQKKTVNVKYYAKTLKPVLWNIIQNKKKLSVWQTSEFWSRRCTTTNCTSGDNNVSRHWWNTCNITTLQCRYHPLWFVGFSSA